MFHATQECASGSPSGTREPDPVAEGAGRRQSDGGASSRRDAFFDNAKYLAIVLVAVGHAWEPVMEGSRATRALYMLVYALHMPAFIVVSGYFSRSYTGRPDQLRKLVTTLLVPYVVFEVGYTLYRRWATGDPEYPLSILDPFYLTWFLIALFVWRLSTPLWRAARWPLPVALGVAMVGTLTPDVGADLDLQRILQFLPFFVLGLQLRREHFALLHRPLARRAAAAVLALALPAFYFLAPRLRMGWFYHSTSAVELDAPWWSGPLMTLALFAGSLLLTASFLALVPRRRTWFTVLGTGTICGYLLHGFLVKSLVFWRVPRVEPWLTTPPGIVAVTLAAAAAVTLLCTPPVRRLLRPVTEPRMDWAFRREAGREVSRPPGRAAVASARTSR
ncbi:acyltransferase family protein [Streptomyces sp. NPDC001941]|uniref:acyltransferase family protein n=1 Tax=Streptomyces sp. NPDC001941 TaxID=3154659 RepID=UPI0033344FAF